MRVHQIFFSDPESIPPGFVLPNGDNLSVDAERNTQITWQRFLKEMDATLLLQKALMRFELSIQLKLVSYSKAKQTRIANQLP